MTTNESRHLKRAKRRDLKSAYADVQTASYRSARTRQAFIDAYITCDATQKAGADEHHRLGRVTTETAHTITQARANLVDAYTEDTTARTAEQEVERTYRTLLQSLDLL